MTVAKRSRPAGFDHDMEIPARRIERSLLATCERSFNVFGSSPAPMSPITQQRQHSSNRRRKSMSFREPEYIKVIAFQMSRGRRTRAFPTRILEQSGIGEESPFVVRRCRRD